MGITPRQLAAVRAHLEAGTTKAAAHQLGCSPHTVRGHLADARQRAGVGTTEQLVYLLTRSGELAGADVRRE